MKIIATEEHMATREVANAWHALELEAADPGVAYHQMGDIEKRLLDLSDGRIARMDEAGVDIQVLSLTTPALHDLGPESVDLARRVNDLPRLCGKLGSADLAARPHDARGCRKESRPRQGAVGCLAKPSA